MTSEEEQVLHRINTVMQFAAKVSRDAGQDPSDVIAVLIAAAVHIGRTYWDHSPEVLEECLKRAVGLHFSDREKHLQ